MNAVILKTADTALRYHEPMARHTSWRVGGTAEMFFEPGSVDQLCRFLADLAVSTPLTWIGLGSNLLVRDGGIPGAVISTSHLPKEFEPAGDGTLRASAALPCATLAKRCARLGLGPAAYFAGIPGSLGGALAMNAGAFGGETWDSVVALTTVDRQGQLRERRRDDYSIGYRSVSGPAGEWFLGASFALSTAKPTESDDIRELLRLRSEKQPLGLASAGSVFRNPEGHHAGALIEQAGLKGLRRGGAVVAEKHANFIINTGTATALDIESLIGAVRAGVLEASGIELVPEVRIIGRARQGQ